MPTGYTAAVKNEEDYPFERFVWDCARAFGALVMMRDDPADSPIRRFTPSDYHEKEIPKAEARLAELEAMTHLQIERACALAYQKELEFYESQLRDSAETAARYGKMMKLVEAWEPPSGEHSGLREFMIQQLKDSIDFDCYAPDKPKRAQPGEWHAQEISRAKRALERHRKEHHEELKRTEERNLWVLRLHESVPMPAHLKADGAPR